MAGDRSSSERSGVGDDPCGGVAAISFGDLDRSERSQLARRASTRSVAAVVLVTAAYAVLPVGVMIDGPRTSSGYLRAGAAVLLALVVLAAQIRSITTARYPQLRVLEGFSLAIPLLLVVFAATYLSMSEFDASAFNEPLNKIGALYFALTTMTTVGFGDIHPRSDPARTVVMVQMIVNFGVVAVASRVAYSAVQRRLEAGRR